MRSNGYSNHSICLLVSYFSPVSSNITQYFGLVGFERHEINANKNGFRSVSFEVEKCQGKHRLFYMPTLFDVAGILA